MTDQGVGARPRLKGQWHVVHDGTERSFFVSEARSFYLDGSLYAHLVPLLDGSSSDAEIAAALRAVVPMSEVARGLARLRHLGVLADGSPEPGENVGQRALAYFDASAVDPSLAFARLRASTVLLAADERFELDLLENVLSESCIRHERLVTSSQIEGAALVIGAYGDYLDPRVLALNEAIITAKVPLLCVNPLGTTTWIGPLVQPGTSACMACLAERLRASRQIDAYVRAKDPQAAPLQRATAAFATSLACSWALTASEAVAALVSPASSRLDGQLLTFDTVTLTLERHRVVRLLQCQACGEPALATRCGEPIVIGSRPKVGSSQRIASAEETAARLSHHVDPITGAVNRLIPLSPGAGGLTYSYAAAHSFAMIGRRFDNLVKAMRGSLSGGKGRTEVAARTGALCEALERFVGVFRGDERRVRSSARELTEPSLTPPMLSQYSDAQFERRRRGLDESRFAHVPERFDASRPIDWTAAWSLSSESRILVPSAYCYFGHPDLATYEFCSADSNGQAAGSCIEEAILQGLYEVVERDSVALWWFNRLGRPSLDLDRLGDRYLDDLREYYRSIDRELWVLDLTADTGIATYAACSRRLEHPVEDIIVGFGAHLDPAAALERALDECNQFLPGVTSRNEDGSTRYWTGADREALEWWQHATLRSEPYLAPDDAIGPIAMPASLASDDVGTDVELALERLSSVDLDLVVVDLTRPDVELSVAKVLVPSMRHFWRQLGPGRLYDVPVRLGWLDEPKREDELNPRTIFF